MQERWPKNGSIVVSLRGNNKGDIYNWTKTPNYNTFSIIQWNFAGLMKHAQDKGLHFFENLLGLYQHDPTVKVPVLSRLLVLKLGGEKITFACFWFKEGSSYGVLVTNFLDREERMHPWWIYWNYMTCTKRVWLVWALITAVWKDEEFPIGVRWQKCYTFNPIYLPWLQTIWL